jgi:hypothetical protein
MLVEVEKRFASSSAPKGQILPPRMELHGMTVADLPKFSMFSSRPLPPCIRSTDDPGVLCSLSFPQVLGEKVGSSSQFTLQVSVSDGAHILLFLSQMPCHFDFEFRSMPTSSLSTGQVVEVGEQLCMLSLHCTRSSESSGTRTRSPNWRQLTSVHGSPMHPNPIYFTTAENVLQYIYIYLHNCYNIKAAAPWNWGSLMFSLLCSKHVLKHFQLLPLLFHCPMQPAR